METGMIAAMGLMLGVAVVTGDACHRQIPSTVRAAMVASAYADLELPRETDNLPEDVADDRKRGGTGCLGVTKGDFDGDGNDDLALVTTEKSGEVILLAALARGRSWTIEVVDFTHYTGREFFIIKAAPPGKYSPDLADPRVGEFTDVRSEIDLSAWAIAVGGGVGDPQPTTRDLWFRAHENWWRCIYNAIR